MGIMDALLYPHFDTETVRQPALKKMLKRTPSKIAIALDESAAIEIVDGRYRILAAKPTGKARRAYWKHGQYTLEEVKITEDFQDLKSLLTKP
jgi:hypothetical protein